MGILSQAMATEDLAECADMMTWLDPEDQTEAFRSFGPGHVDRKMAVILHCIDTGETEPLANFLAGWEPSIFAEDIVKLAPMDAVDFLTRSRAQAALESHLAAATSRAIQSGRNDLAGVLGFVLEESADDFGKRVLSMPDDEAVDAFVAEEDVAKRAAVVEGAKGELLARLGKAIPFAEAGKLGEFFREQKRPALRAQWMKSVLAKAKPAGSGPVGAGSHIPNTAPPPSKIPAPAALPESTRPDISHPNENPVTKGNLQPVKSRGVPAKSPTIATPQAGPAASIAPLEVNPSHHADRPGRGVARHQQHLASSSANPLPPPPSRSSSPHAPHASTAAGTTPQGSSTGGKESADSPSSDTPRQRRVAKPPQQTPTSDDEENWSPVPRRRRSKGKGQASSAEEGFRSDPVKDDDDALQSIPPGMSAEDFMKDAPLDAAKAALDVILDYPSWLSPQHGIGGSVKGKEKAAAPRAILTDLSPLAPLPSPPALITAKAFKAQYPECYIPSLAPAVSLEDSFKREKDGQDILKDRTWCGAYVTPWCAKVRADGESPD